MNQEAIGKFIAQCRKDAKLTQAQLAEQLGVSDKSISRWENGKTMPDLSLYEPLCQALDIQVSELLNASRMTPDEKVTLGERSAIALLGTKAQLETLGLFTEILIVVGILIAITLTRLLAHTPLQTALTLAAGWFVWGFGLVLRVKIRTAIRLLEQE